MLKFSRVVGTPDTQRIGKAVSYPGIDPRQHVSFGSVLSFGAKPDGVFAQVQLLPTETIVNCHVSAFYAGHGFGFYSPLKVDDFVIVSLPDGDPAHGGVIHGVIYSASDVPPQQAVDNPQDVVLRVENGATLRIVTSGGGKVVIDTGDDSESVKLGDEGLGGHDGVVNGQSIDSFTNLPQWLLGNASGVVLAKK